MTYLSNFNPSHMALINSVMPTLEKIKPGRSALVHCQTPKGRERMRYLLYSWFNYNNLKELYSIRMEGPANLRVFREESLDVSVTCEESRSTEFIKEHLLDILNEEEAIAICRANGLDPAELISVIEEWRRVQGI